MAGLVRLAKLLQQRGASLAGLLQIDAFVRTGVEGGLEIDVEYSHLHGVLLATPDAEIGEWPCALILNRDICTSEERHAVERLAARARPDA